MRQIPDLARYIRALVHGQDVKGDLEDEIRFHLERRTELLMSQGMRSEEAAREARRRFGDLGRVRKHCYAIDRRRVRREERARLLDTLRLDLGYAVRTLRAHPGFTAVAVLTLALGIGANTAVFSLVNPYLLRPLPFRDADRLYHLYHVDARRGFLTRFSLPQFYDFDQQARAFENLAAYDYTSVNLVGEGEPERFIVGRVTVDMFTLLGVKASLGRVLAPGEDRVGTEKVIVLGQAVWQRKFGRARDVIGRTIRLDGEPYTIIGVMPAGFNFPYGEVKMWIPLPDDPDRFDRDNSQFQVVGRLRAGASVEEARAEIEAIQSGLADLHPETDGRYGIAMKPLRRALLFYDDLIRPMLFFLWASVGFVLLLVVANVANLMLARSGARKREVAIRAALGGARGRLIRQLLTEAGLLSLLGGAAGVGLAWLAVDRVAVAMPEGLFRVGEIEVDSAALLLALGVSLTAALLFGIAPALQATRVDMARSLNEAGARAGGAGGAPRARMRGALVVAQVGLALVLLVGATVVIRALVQLQSVETGFDAHNVLTLQLTPSSSSYTDRDRIRAYYDDVLMRLEGTAEVEGAAAVYPLPLNFETITMNFRVEGQEVPTDRERPFATYIRATPGYFAVMGLPLVRGRSFTRADGADAPGVVIVNRALARRFWLEADPVGRRIRLGDEGTGRWVTVVGVVPEVRHRNLWEEVWPQIYVPFAQAPVRSAAVVARASDGNPSRLAGPVREAVWAIDPNVPISEMRPMTRVVSDSVGPFRIVSALVTVLGVVALILASVGIYGVVAFTVSRRRHEIAIRIALGAERGDVVWLVLRQGARLTLVGVALGLVSAFGLTWVLTRAFEDMLPGDVATFAVSALTLAAVALLASYLPALRAARVDPMITLRSEW